MASNTLELASEIHDSLLKLVAPATPDSIRASSLGPRKNTTLFFICICAAVSLGCVIYGSAPCPDTTTAAACTQRSDLWQIVGGAGLGSAFYALYTASGYIKSSTFDPKYNSTYAIRFGLGLLAGIILAYLLRNQLPANDSLKNISATALALLGGYASEAVAKILDRLSETLVTVVSGSDKDKVEAARQKAEADADKKTAQSQAEAAKKTAQAQADAIKALQLALNSGDLTTMRDGVQKVMQDMLDPK